MVFVLVRFHFYYQVLLHVPIFQLVDTSEVILMAPASAIIWMFYVGAMETSKFIKGNEDFTKFQKWTFQLIVMVAGLSYLGINYLNDPLVRQFIKWPWHYRYWYIWFPILILFVIAYEDLSDEIYNVFEYWKRRV